MPSQLKPGGTFADRYAIEGQIGTGGMASVWLAYDRSLERLCALKVLDAGEAANPDAKNRFHREARVTARVRSACVVNIFDHGEWQGLPYIAMEYLEGEDLASRITRERKLDLNQTCEVVVQVARGLTHAHASGVVHRDIKPENVFLVSGDEAEAVKILDFGIATRFARSKPDDAQSGLFLGTPMYASPEQLRGEGVDFRTDLWSLGVVAFECLTGHAPFTGDTLDELCGRILTEPLPRLSQHDADLPAALDDLLVRALSRDPEQRFQSAKELAEAFTSAAGCARVSIPSLPPRAEALSLHGEVLPAPKPAKSERRLLPRWLRPALAAALLLAAAAGYQRARANDGAGASARVAVLSTEAARPALSTHAPQVTVAELPDTLDEVCNARPRAPERDERSAPPAHHPSASKAKAPPAPTTAETWRRDPGF